jgi:AcrR family transcriptional regulator
MARPKAISDDDILEAARAVFKDKGVLGTTAEVAARAGVSEGTLFNRFKSKEDLFRHAVAPRMVEKAWLDALMADVGRGEVRARLEAIAERYTTFFEELVPFILLHNANPQLAGPPRPHPAIRQIAAIAAYLEAEMSLGRIRRRDPEVTARVFLGALFNDVFLGAQLRGERRLDRAAFIGGLVDVVWEGIAPQPGAGRDIGRGEGGRRPKRR